MKHFVRKDVGLQLAHEEERERAWIAAAHDAGIDAAAEVVADDPQRDPRRAPLVFRAEGKLEGGLGGEMHLHRDRRADDPAKERDDTLGELPEHQARVLGGIHRRELVEHRRDHRSTRHRAHEELLLRREVPQDRGGGDAEAPADVGERGAVEPAGDEDRAGGIEDLVAGDARWAAHL